MTHTALNPRQFDSLFCGCESSIFPAWANVPQNLSLHLQARNKPTHCTAMIARKLDDMNADMDCYAVPPPGCKAGGDSKREELCQQDPSSFSTTATGAASSSGRPEASGAASSSGRPEATRDQLNAGEGNFLQRNLFENAGSVPSKRFEPQKEEQDFRTRVLHSICATCGKDPADLRYFPFNAEIWSRFTNDCLWGSPRITRRWTEVSQEYQFLIQSVQRQVQTLIERMRCTKNAGIAVLGKILLVTNYVAELSSSKTDQDESPTCSQILRCVLESRIQIHPTIGQQIWIKYRTNTELTNNGLGSPRDSIRLALAGASAIDINTFFQIRLDGLEPQVFGDRIVVLSMLNDNNSTKKGSTEICMHNAFEVAAFAATFKPWRWCLWGPASERTWWKGNLNKPQDSATLQHRKWLTMSNVILHIQYFQQQYH